MRFVRKIFVKLKGYNELLTIFTGLFDPAYTYTLVTSLDQYSEDIFYAYVYQSQYKNKHSKANKDRPPSKAKVVLTTYKGIPELPLLYIPAYSKANTVEQTDRQVRAFRTLIKDLGSSATDFSVLELIRIFVESKEVGDKEATKTTDNLTSKATIYLYDDIDNLNSEQQRRLIQAIANSVEVIYEDLQRQDKSFFSVYNVNPIRSIATQVAKVDSTIRDIGTKKLELLATPKVLSRFLELQVSLNRYYAILLLFTATVNKLGLQVTTDLASPNNISNYNFRIEYYSLLLKPQQPQGSAQLARILSSDISATILVDNVGLRKTIIAYIAVVELSIQ